MEMSETANPQRNLKEQLLELLSQSRGIHSQLGIGDVDQTRLQIVQKLAESLENVGHSRESEAFRQCL